MMTALSSDYMSRLLIGAIAVFFTWAQVHQPIRERFHRYLFPIVVMLCVLWLIHLPRLPGIVHFDDAKVSVHLGQSEWAR